MRHIVILTFVWLLAACATIPPGDRRPVTILISVDGLRPDAVTHAATPTLARMARDGASGAMRPSFPSNTFPNHYTLVTGLTPDRHGVVENNMLDPEIPGVEFRLANSAAVSDGRWWNDGTPVWVSAQRAGVRSVAMFWPGTEAAIQGVRPSRFLSYDETMTPKARVDQLVAWLDAPAPDRPGFATLYFEGVDDAGHYDGVGSPGMEAALARVDTAIAGLEAALRTRGIAANLVIVSDHGMATMSPDRRIYVEDFMPEKAARTLTMGPLMTVYPEPGRTAEVEAALLAPRPHMQCWRKGEIPARYGYGKHRRVAPIVCMAEPGWGMTTRDWVARAKRPGAGAHGFDPAAPDMAATFIAYGPAFRAGVRLPTFDNVSVYPLLMRLIRVRPEPNHGRLADTEAALR
jgi:predicted AlkP superfamily pyrophosphatase or phosphodiesterase